MGHPSAVMILLATLLVACATPQERQARQVEEETYHIALQRLIQGHVYGMSCEALLPLALDMLWESPYDGADYTDDRTGLTTAWRHRDETRQSRLTVHGHRAGDDRCAVQVITHERIAAQQSQRRDSQWEMQLLERVDAEAANRLRLHARREARQAHDQFLEQRHRQGDH